MSRKIYDWEGSKPTVKEFKDKLDKYGLPESFINEKWIPAVWCIIHCCEEMSLYPQYDNSGILFVKCKLYNQEQGRSTLDTRGLNRLATKMDNWRDFVGAVSNNGTIYNHY